MSEETTTAGAEDASTPKQGAKKAQQQARRGGFGPGFVPGESASNFKGSGKRFLARLKPMRFMLGIIALLTIGATILGVFGPRLLGNGTNAIVSGVEGTTIGNTLVSDGLMQKGQTLPKSCVMPLLEAKPGAMPNLPASCNITPQMLENAAAKTKGQTSLSTDMVKMLGGVDFTAGKGIDFTALRDILLAVILIYLGSALLQYVQGLIATKLVQDVVYGLRQEIEVKLGRLPLSYFDHEERGDILSRVTNDLDNISQTLQQTLSQLITSIATIIGVIVMMLTISWLLTILVVVIVPVGGVIAQLVMRKSKPQFTKQWASTGELNAHIEEMYTGHSLVKVFGHQKTAEKQFHDKNSDLYNSSFRAQFISNTIMPIMMFVSNASYVAVAVVAGLRVASGQLSLGDMQAFIQYSRQFTQPVTQVASMANLLQSGVASAERVFDLLDADEQTPDPADPIAVDNVQGRIEFTHVAFSYSEDKPLITDLNLLAKPGQTVAIVGPTGAGKTTLVNLLERFYDIDKGTITLDGVDTVTMGREALRSNIGMVLQDTWLFNGSIHDNIAYGKPGATEDEILAAAKATYVDRFVHSLPEGYETVVDEEGSNVSAGEKQLLTIARAFLADPAILILDEATSSVDTRTELLVQRAMNALREGRTSFVIAHRLSTIRDADTILVMEHGDIVEQGNHDSLMAAGGAYARLYQSQFAGATSELD